jgi:hypothetical protein
MIEPIDSPKRKHEREVWESLYGSTLEARSRLETTRDGFYKLFRAGHKTSVREMFAEVAAKVSEGITLEQPFHECNDVHPRAWELLLTHGKHYQPRSWRIDKPWEWRYQPIAGSCFINALDLILMVRDQKPASRLTYVEGFCMGPMIYPMLHAWNGYGFAGRCHDWTFYAHTMFNRYFGIPFTFEEYCYINPDDREGEIVARMMFRRDEFEQVEDRICQVLKKPRTRLV